MKVVFRTSFVRDIKKIKDQNLLDQLNEIVLNTQAATILHELPNIKKLSASHGCYRIRVQEYRVGLFCSKDVVEFVRFLHRSDAYKFFP